MKDKIDITEELKEYMVKPRSGAKRIKRSTLKNLYLKPLTRFAPDPVNGLTAAQVNERILQNKVNKKSKKYSKSVTGIIASNLFTFFNLLCVVCVIALMSVKAPIMNYTFAFVYVVNVAIGIFQEIRAKLTIEKLSLMNESPAKVLREGKFVDIPNSEIVMDEIIKFSYGNQISADCTVISGSAEVNESLLTGESTAVKKTAGSKLYAGSFVVSGEIIAVADKVGEDRYIQILAAKAKKYKKPSSELLRTLNAIIKTVGLLIIPIALGALWTNYNAVLAENLPQYVVSGELTELGLRKIVMHTTSVIISMIPAGMFLLTTIALAVGVIRLAAKQTSVQDMYALERLARVNVLCLDKTGTITDGRMKVSNCIVYDINFKYTLSDIISSMQSALRDSNQTAIALKNYFGVERKFTANKTIPFSSERKYSAATFYKGAELIGTFVLGAPEFVMDKYSLPKTVESHLKQYAAMGQRILLLAYSEKEIKDNLIPSDLAPFALITLCDNIRTNATETIAWFKENGVEIKVISGDNPLTVSEVARRAGVDGADKFVSLEGMSNTDVFNAATKYNVFGRVSPEQKAILIRALKAAGKSVAMTGDGVNDILAMKESDCSVTVATGSEATKNVAHLVLMNNDFNSLPAVVGEGRRVINNIERSSSLYLMKTFFTIVFAMLCIFTGRVFPFDNQMMIMLEVVVIGIGSFALSMQANNNRVDGKFISYVLIHALPGAAILLLNVFIFDMLEKQPFGITLSPTYFQIKDTLMIAAMASGGLAYLGIICKPYNLFRTVLVLSLTAFSVVWLLFFMPAFNMHGILFDFQNNWKFIALLLCFIQFDIALGNFLTLINKKISENFKIK